jgi:hypothetical protein
MKSTPVVVIPQCIGAECETCQEGVNVLMELTTNSPSLQQDQNAVAMTAKTDADQSKNLPSRSVPSWVALTSHFPSRPIVQLVH